MGYISLVHAKISSTNKSNSTKIKKIVLTQPIHEFENNIQICSFQYQYAIL